LSLATGWQFHHFYAFVPDLLSIRRLLVEWNDDPLKPGGGAASGLAACQHQARV